MYPSIHSSVDLGLEPLLSLEGVCRYFKLGNQQVAAVDAIDLVIPTGCFCAIVGPSGSGKSTLLNLLGLLDRPTRGRYKLAGQDTQVLSDRSRACLRNSVVGFVFQQFRLIPALSVIDNVCLPYLYGDWDRAQLRANAVEWLQRLGLSERMLHRPEQLSGGERQRVAIARALVTKPLVLLADEPTGALDSENGKLIMQLLRDIHKEAGVTVVMITHDASLARQCSMQVNMLDGHIDSVEMR